MVQSKTPTKKSRLQPRRGHDRKRLVRRLLQEPLETRHLMAAAGPSLIAINPDAGKLFSLVDASQNRLDVAPTELTLRFDPGRIVDPLGGPDIPSRIDPTTLAQGVRVAYSRDTLFGNADDVVLSPGFLGLDDKGRIITFRFVQTPENGFYRISVSGQLFNVDGLATTPQTVDFQLALGARVKAVVPQPITRQANGTLVQSRNQIEVYFNDDDLRAELAQDPAFYRLIHTADTIRNTDDQVFIPSQVTYDAALDRVVLTFANDLSTLVGGNGVGTLRLRIGALEPQALAPVEQTVTVDPRSSFSNSLNLNPIFDSGAILRVGPGSQINDGGTFSVSLPNSPVVRVFLLDDPADNGVFPDVPPGATVINYSKANDALTVAQLIAAELISLPNATILTSGNAASAEIRIVGDSGITVNLGTSGLSLVTRGLVISSEISNAGQRYPLTLQGANTDPGERQYLLSPTLLARADTQDGIATLYYNFAVNYGTDAQGNQLPNANTPARQQRFREVFSLLSDVIGAQFVETADRGFQLVTGDMRAIDVNIDTGVGGPLLAHRVSDVDPSRGLLILDSGETWDDSFGTSNTVGRPSFFETAMRGVLNLLGVGDSFDLPPGETIAGTRSAPLGPNTFNLLSGPQVLRRANAVEPDYPGDTESVRAQHLYRPESKDIDLYRFEVQQPGVFTAETFAERLPSGSLLNTALIIWRENANGTRTRVARNDDYFGTDSYIELNLAPGVYYIGVSAAGNENYNPEIEDSGYGGTSEGAYQLRLGFRPDVSLTIRDRDGGPSNGTAFDGDGDGVAGGTFDFWFRTAPPATAANVTQPRTLYVDKASTGVETGGIASPFRRIDSAMAAAKAGDIIRIVGNNGADGLARTLVDNLPYQFGASVPTDATPRDGISLDIKAGVTVMVDAGAIFKLRQTRIGVGSSDPNVDRSNAALQVLGIPYAVDAQRQPLLDSDGRRVPGSVYFTSYEDETIGLDTNSLPTVPGRGQWGGIEFQLNVDISQGRERLEREGIFLNFVSHADMRYGGGTVAIDGTPRVIRPITMLDARPTILSNRITESNGAAISATPGSFAENNFNDPASALPASSATQQFPFASDVRRIGPTVQGNTLLNNTLNGLFVDIDAPAGAAQRVLSVPARWNDTDITHIVSSNLLIEGQPGGALFSESGPAITTVTATALHGAANGSLPAGTYRYRLTFLNVRGGESPASWATTPATLTAVGGVRLNNLPAATGQFTSRNLYREQADGSWLLVRRLDASSSTVIDNGVVDGGLLRRNTPNSGDVALTPIAGGTLSPGTYDYRFVFNRGVAGISEASLATRSLTITGNPNATGGPGNGTIRLTGLPSIPPGQTLEIYRRDPRSGDYLLAGIVPPGTTTFTDRGSFDEAEPNDTLATAQNIDSLPFVQRFNPNVDLSTVRPYVTIRGTGNATFDYYSFTVTAGATATFDIDNTSPGFNTELFLYDAAGNLLNANDDFFADTGSLSNSDSYLTHLFPSGGTFIIGVGKFDSVGAVGGIVGTAPSSGDLYDLHISIDGKGSQIGSSNLLPVSALGVELPRASGRLSIDPGVIVKVEGSRIETSFGADLYAEAIEGREIVFTSLLDDSYGRGGTFDTSNNGASVGPTPGKWSGIYFGHNSDGGLENVRLSYAGGTSPLGGSAAGFNAVEVHQADVRIARSVFANNASGIGGALGIPNTLLNFPADQSGVSAAVNPLGDPATRAGRGFNAAATIFVRGAQPTIVENVIRDGAGPALSINANALIDSAMVDPGRAIGDLAARAPEYGNRGPLIRENLLGGNLLDGMVVRSETTTTSTVWDDTDITHLVFGEIIVPDYHHEGGLALTSRPGESLVIKLSGANAGFSTLGRPLDIADRIGGAIYLQGTAGFPVIMTSLHDDLVGSGFGFDGKALTNTDSKFVTTVNNQVVQISPAAGQWRGIRLEEYSHDRNVAPITETERFDVGANGINNVPGQAQFLGLLATDEKHSDENLRLGFLVNGVVSNVADYDVYSFQGTAGTEVWFDIDRTSFGLDTVVELLDVNGNILALSDNAHYESLNPAVYPDATLPVVSRPLRKGNSFIDLDSTNPKDAGMRVILPGAAGTRQLYFVRVRSSSIDVPPESTLATHITARQALLTLAPGKTSGRYQLQVRLRETEEVPGSSLNLADIRFATTALHILGGISHSPLGGEGAEIITNGSDNNGNVNSPYVLGNLNQSDRAALSAQGTIQLEASTGFGTDVDFYRFFVQPTTLRTPQDPPDALYTPVTIDVDYADAYGRANTSIALFDNQGRLIAIGQDSNVADDQGSPLRGADTANLGAGSAGVLDPFLGPIMLLSDGPGVGGTVNAGQTSVVGEQGTIAGRWYSVAVHSVATVPQVLDQFFNPNSANPDVRLIPNDAIRLLTTDDFRSDIQGASGTSVPSTITGIVDQRYTADQPIYENPFNDQNFNGVVPFNLSDVTLFVGVTGGITGNNQNALVSVNPFTGSRIAILGQSPQNAFDGGINGDIGMRRDGELFTISLRNNVGTTDQGNTGNFINLEPSGGGIDIGNNQGDDGLTTPGINNDPTRYLFSAMAFNRDPNSPVDDSGRFLGVATRTGVGLLPNVFGVPVPFRNIVYSMVTNSGAATNRGSTNAQLDRQAPQNAGGPFQGTGSNKLEMGVIDTTRGELGNPGTVTERTITGLAQDPSNPNQYFAVDDEGGLYSFNLNQFTPGDQNTLNGGVGGLVFQTTFLGIVADEGLEGLTFGPRDVEHGGGSIGAYRNTLFAMSASGTLYAFDKQGRGQPVFIGGRSFVETEATFGSRGGTVTGIAFSTLERNLFHTTTDRGNDNTNRERGHGQFDTPTESRARSASTGGKSFYFGNQLDANEDNNALDRAPGDNGSATPGGAIGSLISKSLDLSDYAVGDRPTLYFNYYLETEQKDYNPLSNDPPARDSFRVYASGDDGVWRLLATNNAFRNPVMTEEFDFFDVNNTVVQELFDNTGTWRQARADLSQFAGQENVRIRFIFSTHGGTDFPLIPDLVELVGVRGSKITDGDTISLTDLNSSAGGLSRSERLEFEKGITLTLPAGSALSPQETLVLTRTNLNNVVTSTTFEFLPVGGTVSNSAFIPIFFSATDTAGQVAAATVNAIAGSGTFADAILHRDGARVQLGFSQRASVVLEQGPATITVVDNVLQLPPAEQIVDGDTFILRRGMEARRVTLVQSQGVVNPNDRTIPFDPTIDTENDVANRVFHAASSFFTGVVGPVVSLQPTTRITNLPSGVLYTNGELQFPGGGGITDLEEVAIQQGPSLFRVILDNINQNNRSAAVAAYNSTLDTSATLATTLRTQLGAFYLDPNQAGINADQIRLQPNVTIVGPLPTGFNYVAPVLTVPNPLFIGDGQSLTVRRFNVERTVYLDDVNNGAVSVSVVGYTAATPAATLANDVGNLLGGSVTINGSSLQLQPGAILLTKPLNVTLLGGQIEFPPPNQLIDPSQLRLVNGPLTRNLILTSTATLVPATRVFVDPLTDTTDIVANRIFAALGNSVGTISGSTITFPAGTIVTTPVPAGLTYNPGTLQLTVTSLGTLIDQSILEVEINGVVQRIEFDSNGLFDATQVTLIGFNKTLDTNAIIANRVFRSLGDMAINSGVTFGGVPFVTLAPGTNLVNAPAGFQRVGNQLRLVNVTQLQDGQVLALSRLGQVRRLEFNDDVLDPARMRVPSAVVQYSLADTPSAIGAKVAQALGNFAGNVSGNSIQLVTGTPDRFTITARPVNSNATGSSGVAAGNFPIYVHNGMNPEAVAIAIQKTLQQAFGGATYSYKRFAERLQLYRFSIDDAGPLGAQISNLQGEEFGDYGSPRFSAFAAGNVNNRGDANNTFEGVYIDDVMVGFAERGELVLNAPPNAAFTQNPEVLAVRRGGAPNVEIAPQPERPTEILTGGYQVELRTSANYGVPWEPRQIIPNLALDNSGQQYSVQSGRSLDTNDRLIDGVTLVVGEPGDYRDGDTFSLSDGTDTKIFEIVDVNVPGSAPNPGNIPIFLDQSLDTRETLARKVRDAINSPESQEVLDIRAQTSDSRDTGISGSHRIDLFGGTVLVNPTLGQNIYLDLVSREILTPVNPFQPTTTDTLRRAVPTGYVSGLRDTLIVNGRLGDRPLLSIDPNFPVTSGTDDADIIRIHLNMGETIDIDIDSLASNPYQAGIAPIVQIYDQQGNLLVTNFNTVVSVAPNDAPGETPYRDGYLRFTAPSSGDYFVEVKLDTTLVTSFGVNLPRDNFPSVSLESISRTGSLVTVTTQTPFSLGTGGFGIVTVDAENDLFDGTQFVTVVDSQTFTFFSAGPDLPRTSDRGRIIFSGRTLDDFITDYNLTVRPTGTRDIISVDLHQDVGDENRFRDQGQLIVDGLTIRNSAGSGILVEAGRSDLTVYGPLVANIPRQGAARHLRDLNVDKLLPGPVLVNNVLDENSQGITILGGASADDPTLFARIVNNTIYGGGSGRGIFVNGSASPTLMNNLLLNNAVGVELQGAVAQQTTVFTSNLYSGNPTPVVGRTLDSADFNLDANQQFQQQVVVDAVAGNFLPAPGSLAIDSSQNSQDDRFAFFQTVKDPVGIGESPILAPTFDALGLLRVDDATQSPIAQGNNLFVDRGAIDRADDRPPFSIIINPLDDTSGVGVDGNPNLTEILFTDPSGQGLRFIEIRVTEDTGTGPDPATLTSANVLLLQNGIPLRDGLDYTFGYNPSSRTIRLTPAGGLFSPFIRYDVILNNGRVPVPQSLLRPEFNLSRPITDLVGLPLEPNRSTLETRYTIVIRSEPPILRDDEFTGANAAIEDAGTITGNVLNNDADPEGKAVTITTPYTNRTLFDPIRRDASGNPVAAGVLTLLANGEMTFTPVPNYYTLPNQPLTFTYAAVDADGAPSVRRDANGAVRTGLATVFIEVLPVNDAPTVSNDGPILMLEDEILLIPAATLLANDFVGAPFEETQVLSIIGSSVAAVNDATVEAPITATLVHLQGVPFVQIVPQQHANGVSKFIYRVRDDGGTDRGGVDETGLFATVTLNIRAVNDAPVPDEDAHLDRGYRVDEDVSPNSANGLRILISDILANDDPAPNRIVEKAIDELIGPRAQSLVFESVELMTENGGQARVVGNEIHYTPPPNFFGTDAIFYVIRDVGPGGSIPENHIRSGTGIVSQPLALTTRGRITLTVNPVNDPPRATPAPFTMLEDTTLTFPAFLAAIQANGGPGENEPLTLALVGSGSANGGSVNITAVSGGEFSLSYRPAPSFFGTDTFVVRLTDVPPPGPSPQMDPRSTLVTVTVTVRPVNDAPVTANDTVHVLEDEITVIPAALITNNDRVDPFADGSLARENRNAGGNTPQNNVRIVSAISPANTNPAGTMVEVLTNGSIRLRPPPNYYTRDRQGNSVAPALTIVYTISDDGSSYIESPPGSNQFVQVSDPKTATGTVTVEVWPVNDAPQPRPHSFFDVFEDTPYTLNVSTLVLRESDLTVGQAPVATKDSAGPLEDVGPDNLYSSTEGLTQVVYVIEPDSQNPQVLSIPTQRGGSIQYFDDNTSVPGFERIVYTPPQDFASFTPLNLTDSVTYRIADNGFSYRFPGGETASLAPPTLVDDVLTGIGTITFSVNPVNDPPQFSIPTAVTVLEDATVNLANFAFGIRPGPLTAIDETTQSVIFQVTVNNPDLFQVVGTGASARPDIQILPDGTLNARLKLNANGQAIVTVKALDNFVVDNQGNPDPEATGVFPGPNDAPMRFTFTVTAVNDPPVFTVPAGLGSPPTFTVAEDAGLTSVTVATNISPGGGTDEANQRVTFIAELVNPSQSSLFLLQPTIDNGQLRFSAKPDVFTNPGQPILIRIRARDEGPSGGNDNNESAPFTLALNITAVNDPPTPRNDPDPIVAAQYRVPEDQTLTINPLGILVNDTDVEGDPIRVVGLGSSGDLTGVSQLGAVVRLGANGSVFYDPTALAIANALTINQTLVDTFTYRIADDKGSQSATLATVSITITGVNDPPVVTPPQSVRVGRDRPTVINVAGFTTDVDSAIDLGSLLVISDPTQGSLSVRGDGTVLYTPNTGYTGFDQFSISIADVIGGRATPVTFFLNVSDVPIAIEDTVRTFRNNPNPIRANVLANDRSFVGNLDPTSVRIAGDPLRGSAQANADGTISYIPALNVTGRDEFFYTVRDSAGQVSDPTRVTVLIASSIGQNPLINTDVNASGQTSALDALIVINHLNRGAETNVSVLAATGVITLENGPFIDVDGNGRVEPIDALLVINALNRLIGQGEAPSPELANDVAMMNVVGEMRDPNAVNAFPVPPSSFAFEDEEEDQFGLAEVDRVFELL